VASWYGREGASIERIGGQFVALALRGLLAPGARARRS
jgi:hypothetical protein